MIEIFSVALLLISYSFGLATLILQIICYLKDLEYRETIFFTASFFLIIVFLTIHGIFKINDLYAINIQTLLINYGIILFGVSVPVNIQKEGISKKRSLRNFILISIAVAVAILITVLYMTNSPHITLIYITSAFIFLSVLFSMINILITKPEAIIKPNERNERVIAVFILIIMAISLITFLSIGHNKTNIILSKKGIILIAILGMLMSIAKIPVDLKKLKESSTPIKVDDQKILEMGITQSEKEIMILLLSGKKHIDIANQQDISLSTLRSHISNIFSKTKVRNRLELLNMFLKK